MITVDFPWPRSELSQNFRGHWSVISKAKKKYRADARNLTVLALNKAKKMDFSGGVRIGYTFYPPANHRYDRDNLDARMKAGTDGIADALRIDDSNFVFSESVKKEKTPPGFVRVTIEGVEGSPKVETT